LAEREVLPLCQTYGVGALVWSPLAKGMLTGRYRKGQPLPDSLRVKAFPAQMNDERNLDAVERLMPIAETAGLSLTHLALAFVMAHPGVTSAILGPRTMQHLDDLLAGSNVVLGDDIAPPLKAANTTNVVPASARQNKGLSRFLGELLQTTMHETHADEDAMQRYLSRAPLPLAEEPAFHPPREDLYDRRLLR
jgi:diketogulonate reductase-like aldo/keto reductase